jgi:hypothetical protein
LPSTIEVLLPMEQDASVLLKGIDYDWNLSACIIVATLRYQKEYLRKKSKNKGKNTHPPLKFKRPCAVCLAFPQRCTVKPCQNTSYTVLCIQMDLLGKGEAEMVA